MKPLNAHTKKREKELASVIDLWWVDSDYSGHLDPLASRRLCRLAARAAVAVLDGAGEAEATAADEDLTPRPIDV